MTEQPQNSNSKQTFACREEDVEDSDGKGRPNPETDRGLCPAAADNAQNVCWTENAGRKLRHKARGPTPQIPRAINVNSIKKKLDLKTYI